MSDKTQIKINIKGRVQGVFFRAETKKTAEKLGIKGYVRNLADGSVEALFQADIESVKQMVKWCHKGAAAAKVEQVLEMETQFLPDVESFEIRY